MKNLEFTEGKALREKDDPLRMVIESVKEGNQVAYYWRKGYVFLQKETHRGWTFSVWVLGERVEMFFSRGKYELVEL